jgi:hypothetical protein
MLTKPVSRNALRARVDRALKAQRGHTLIVDRGRDAQFHILDPTKQELAAVNVDLVALGRELGVLQKWERLK